LGDAPQQEGPIRIPTHEKGGREIWDGRRGSLSFSRDVKEGMEKIRVRCQLKKTGCTGVAEAIDHNPPFTERQTWLKRYLICDGSNHFVVCFKDKAQEQYDAAPLVWACTKCNSSKGGMKGVNENPPQRREPCPGVEDCEVPPGGQEIG
jgi:hypothetical protein